MSLQSTDPIADLLTRIRNAVLVGKNEVKVPASNFKKIVADQLVKNNFVHKVSVENAKPRDLLVIQLAEDGNNSPINEIKRISKPGKRIYVGANDVPKIKQGRGLVLISTSKGVMSGTEAKKLRLGGEVLLSVY